MEEDAKVIKSVRELCPYCMEEHEVKTVLVWERFPFQGVDIEYECEYQYCENADEYYSDERQITENWLKWRAIYQKKIAEKSSDQNEN